MSQRQLDRPQLTPISRRDFLVLTASASAAATLSVAPLAGDEASVSSSGGHKVQLSASPSHNPAFMVRATGDGGLLLWTRQGDGAFLGFRINASGRELWRLCDGTTPPEQIARRWADNAGRPQPEATTFLDELLANGILAAGGHVVTAGDFPRPGDGGYYRMRLSSDDPVSL